MSSYDSRGNWNSGSRPSAAPDRSGRQPYGGYTPRDSGANGASGDYDDRRYYGGGSQYADDARDRRDYSGAPNDAYSNGRYSQPSLRSNEDYDDDEYGRDAYQRYGGEYQRTTYASADDRSDRYSGSYNDGYNKTGAGEYYASYDTNDRYSRQRYDDYNPVNRGGSPEYAADNNRDSRYYQPRYNDYNQTYRQPQGNGYAQQSQPAYNNYDGYGSANAYSQPQYAYDSDGGTRRITPSYARPTGGKPSRSSSVSVWLVLVLLVAIPPVGMALLWSQNSFTLKGRVILSAISIGILLIWCYALFNRSVGDPVSVVGTPENVPVYTSSNATAEPLQTIAPVGATTAAPGTVGTVVNAPGTSANAAANETDSLDVKVYTLADGAVYYHKYAVCNETSYPSEITLGDALAAGLSPCRRCNPPTYNSSAG